MTHLRSLTTKRVAENAPQNTIALNQRSRAFSATHLTDENAQLVGLTGGVRRSSWPALRTWRRDALLARSGDVEVTAVRIPYAELFGGESLRVTLSKPAAASSLVQPMAWPKRSHAYYTTTDPLFC